jgi:hypothetical protein
MGVDNRVDINIAQLSLLANDAYKVDSSNCSRVGDDWWPWDEFGQRYCTASQVGFYARMYYSPTRKALIAAFRGTTGEEGRKNTIFENIAHYVDMVDDLVTDVKQFGMGFKVNTEQAKQALKFIDGAKYLEKQGYKLIGCTGHSLGGGLAHICAIHRGIPAVGFNPAPHDSFGNINPSAKNMRFVYSYVTENDPVSRLTIFKLPGMGNDYYNVGVANGAIIVKGARGGHSMSKLTAFLQKAPEGKHQPFAWTPALQN